MENRLAIFTSDLCVNLVLCDETNIDIIKTFYPTGEAVDADRFEPALSIGDKRETMDGSYVYFRTMNRWDKAQQKEISEKLNLSEVL